MRKMTGLFLLVALSLALAACSGASLAPATTAPTAVPTPVPTQAPIELPTQPAVSNPADASAAGLVGAPWMWVQAVDANGASSAVSNSSAFRLVFSSGGQLDIATACKGATGTYTVNGNALSINLVSTTQTVCPGDKLSAQFLVEVASVQSYSLEGGQLVLNLGGGGSLRLSR